MNKFLRIIINLIILGVIIFFFRVPLQNLWVNSFNYYFPCKQPITYSIGTFDTRFGITQQDFISAMKDAETIWEKPISRDLFAFSSAGNLKVNLIYDARQKTTIQLQKMGIVVKDNRESYDALKIKYDTIRGSYSEQKVEFEARIEAFDIRRKAYESEVISANKHGGVNKETYNRLNIEKEYLQGENAEILLMQDNLNITVNDINTLSSALNQLATDLNIDVNKFNTVGDSLGEEFNEGLYKSDSSGQEIDVFQFENRTKLIRVLAHELGHALGLDHVDDPKAIMYRLNNGINEKLTDTDIVELKTLCGVE